jgi:hypothetical protein
MTNNALASLPCKKPSLLLYFIGAYDLVAIVCLVYLIFSALSWTYQNQAPRLSLWWQHNRPVLQQTFMPEKILAPAVHLVKYSRGIN